MTCSHLVGRRWYVRGLEFGILGPLAAWGDGREFPLGGAKQRGLLGVLLLHPNELVPTARIVEGLWGEQPPASAVQTVQVLVSRLRKVLGEGVLETKPGGYALRVEPGGLDAERFQQWLDDGRNALAAGRAGDAAVVLREALSLWRGPPLADFQYESFAQNEIGRLDELRLVATELRVEAELAQGRHAEVVGELEALVRDQPLRERPRALLMLGLYRSGRHADALAVYQETRAQLVDELGLDPSPLLQQLEQAILRQDTDLELPALSGLQPTTPESVPPPKPSRETRKTVTVLFCDVASSEELDPEALRAVARGFFEDATAAVESHGGTAELLAGDELFCVFGIPSVREDDALRATRAAAAIKETAAGVGLDARIGINTGEVLVGDGPVSGDAVTLAKRLEEQAAAGEILIGKATHMAVAHAVAATPLGTGVARLESVDADAMAVARRDDARFVGREPELARLQAAYEHVVAGEGARLVTLVGEPGIGKSRLAREAIARFDHAPMRLVGRCPPYGEGITFWPLHELLQQAGREEVDLAGPTREVFAAVRHLLNELAIEQPVVVVFDDVQWAEPTFLDLVEHLAARLGDARVLLVSLARPQFAEQRPAWLQPPAESISLEPLSEEDSVLLLESIGTPATVRARIAETAEGNPLFAEQLAAIADETGAASMPDSIRGVLHERLDRLDGEERVVLERAAVAGRSFSLGAVLALSSAEEAEEVPRRLLSLVRKRFVWPDPLALDEGFRFKHALIRDATYDAMPKAVRAELHARTAEKLDAEHAEHAIVGFHLEQSFQLRRDLGAVDDELRARAAWQLRAAAQEAFGRSDLSATLALYGRARALLPDDDLTVPGLLTELGYACVKRGDIAGAERHLDEAIGLAGKLGDRSAELRATIERQFVRSVAAVGPTAEESVRVAAEAIPELERLDDPLGLARAWWLKSEGDAFACRWRGRAAALECALACARRAEAGLDVAGTIASLLAQALCYGPTSVTVALQRVSDLLVEAGTDRALRATVSTSLAWLHAMQGSFQSARTTYAEAIATFDELGLPLRRAVHAQYGAQIELLAGDAEAAAAELEAATDALTLFGARGVAATLDAVRADVLCTLGRWEEAESVTAAVIDAAAEDDLMPQLLWRAAQSRILVRCGEIAKAELLAAEALNLADGLEMPDVQVAVLRAVAEVAAAAGRPERAAELVDIARAELVAKGNLVGAERCGLVTILVSPSQGS